MSDEVPEEEVSNVISIATRKPLVRIVEPTEEELQEVLDEERQRIIAGQLEGVDKLRRLVETGRMSAIVVCGQMADDKTTFYNDVIVGDPLEPNDAVPFLGALELLKGEMTELAYMADIITAEGTLTKPIIELDGEWDDDFE